MADVTKGQEARGGVRGGEIGSPISNECYDVIRALASKLEGLEAFRKYAKDGNEQIWKQISDLDKQAVMVLVDQLEQIAKDGKLRSLFGEQPSLQ